MSYLVSGGQAIYPTTKWRMGAYVRNSPVPVVPELRRSTAPRLAAYLRRTRLGQFTETLTFPPGPPDVAPNIVGLSPSTEAQVASAVNSLAPPSPPPAGQPQGPYPATPPTNYTSQPMSLDPLNFVSPQAAIAAGANPTATYAAWNKAVGSFPSQQAAIAAGVPAGVVTQLWASSRATVPTLATPSWLDQSTFGIKNLYLVLGVGVTALVAASGKGRR